jgi:signal transduction histidine kinase
MTPLHEKILAMNEALVLGSVRQHELAEASEHLNEQLRLEISERKVVETALRASKETLRKSEEALRESREEIKHRAEDLEKEVTARTADLTATNKQMESFVYSIAHDLRAPLRAMQGYATMLVKEAGAALNETGQGYANRINKSAQFMDRLLIDLLAFSRISQERVELASVNLEQVAESVLFRLQKDIQDKKALVQKAGLWPAVLGHEATLAQVLFNLVANALKFVIPGVPPVVRLRAEDRGEFIRLWVEDNGPGIAPDHQSQIFRLFTRLEGEKYPGTGIGLAIVQKGIERMGGKVGVESALGQGCRFWFDLRKA